MGKLSTRIARVSRPMKSNYWAYALLITENRVQVLPIPETIPSSRVNAPFTMGGSKDTIKFVWPRGGFGWVRVP